MAAVNLALQMALLIAVGFFARKKRIVDEHFSSSLAAFIFNFVFPAIIINALQDGSGEHDAKSVLVLVLVAPFTIVLMLAVGGIVNRLTGKKDEVSRLILVNLAFTNFTYMAFPVMESLFGSEGLFYISIYTIPVRVMFYILVPLILGVGVKHGESGANPPLSQQLKKVLLSPPVLAVPIGLLIYSSGFSLPIPIAAVIRYLANVATPMGMVLCGVTLASVALGQFGADRRVWLSTGLRLVLAPLLMLGLYFLARVFFTPDLLVSKIVILYCALPVSATTAVMAIKMKCSPQVASQTVFLTTVLSIATLPLWVAIVERVVV